MKELDNNAKSIFTRNGASNHSLDERESLDYYATEPKAVELLLELEDFQKNIWEAACGGGHISRVLEENGYKVYSTDLVDRGYEIGGKDFFEEKGINTFDIITNPPYKIARKFVEHALDISANGVKVAMFLKLTFLESRTRKEFFKKYPPKVIYVSASRLKCAKNGDFLKYGNGVGTAIAYAWYIWEKGYEGDTIIKWFN